MSYTPQLIHGGYPSWIFLCCIYRNFYTIINFFPIKEPIRDMLTSHYNKWPPVKDRPVASKHAALKPRKLHIYIPIHMAPHHMNVLILIPTDTSPYSVNLSKLRWKLNYLLPTGSEERGVLGVGSIPVAILPSCQDMKTIAL